MRVSVEIYYGEKNYSLRRETETYFPGQREDITEFVRSTLTEVIADIERLESHDG
jgi:uncharacterized lipoprotein YajG